MRTWSFAKGHGTLNDFVLVADPAGVLNPSAGDVRFLCDRRRGIGADGFLRAIKAEQVPDWDGSADLWFMDYRNADGSLAEMCGNGLRVFVLWLLQEHLASGTVLDVATRAGLRRAIVQPDGQVRVAMGTPRRNPVATAVRLGDHQWYGYPVDVGNPHCVVRLTDLSQLASLDLTQPVGADPGQFPEGANAEFVVGLAQTHLRMRVVERGVGETASCGTGAVAVSLDARERSDGGDSAYLVEVPGGVLTVDFDSGGAAWLTGPASIVARGEVVLPDD